MNRTIISLVTTLALTNPSARFLPNLAIADATQTTTVKAIPQQ